MARREGTPTPPDPKRTEERIRGDFSVGLSARENPQRAADRILKQYRSGNDDALVLVARLMGIDP
jgi:hypothetical protein